ncbi:helix-turn-helix domain-containing protein [Chryseobacterium sp. PTM-20240506]|jgi:hypothetical protein|uniref:helix-turn-helix domain-containing protein n=1 Tax=unclassified Chryseobacterium TaxID=2593645 RepID=UPI00235A0946|nr:helix-turn-helix domain-containing protein [Chryseobacterium sp. B21-037]MDC8102924.1 helix-turn-helix domain-containing protein [Chryseobacterium sp. B21-037]MDC8107189.1 helix-turn-helix domain-containing protein [Chryseobacterium sp. B21-037]WBV56379.1 helix-turn-helix domain containing protein [Chryseobacterium daecheongense]WBV56411.1 helix-turn-helix domain containing protein [Chryseobacterium daecheongense]
MEDKKTSINYGKIYLDIISKKFPEKATEFEEALQKTTLTALDIIKINQKIYGLTNQESNTQSQKFRSYDRASIIEMLDYQKNNLLNNTQTAKHFSISRNTITKWKKKYY